jgi:HSP20 family protein
MDKLTPLSTIRRMRDEMERIFDRFFEDPWMLPDVPTERGTIWAPTLDMSETEEEVILRAEVPGVDAKHLEITVSGHTLTLAGEKKEESEKKGENYYHCERSFGAFRRSIELPETADPEKVTAEHDNGVVTIRVAKLKGAKPREIPVKPAKSSPTPVGVK